MNAKQYLSRAYRLNALINSDVAELERLKALSTSLPSPAAAKEPGGTVSQDPAYVRKVNRIVDLEKKINEEVDGFVAIKQSIHECISSVDNLDERLLLKLRYVDLKSWEEISDEMGYSLQHVFRLHKEAIKSVENAKR